MNNEYIITFRWLRDDYTRLRDGTELFERVNERYANANCDVPGSSATQQDLNSLRSSDHDFSINTKSVVDCSNDHLGDSNTVSQGPSTEWPNNDTKQNVPRRPRKGHKKSRRGCYNCKKRKVKCQETLPSCQNCARNQLSCNYPTLPPPILPLKSRQIFNPSPVPYGSLQATPTIFSLDEMFIFHHFLIYAHPYLPVGSKEKWVRHVPVLAHHNSFLLHAILGLSASHIASNSPFSPFDSTLNSGSPTKSYHTLSLHHRILAICGLSALFARLNPSTTTKFQRQTIQATLYLLTFQSCYISDLSGFFELLHFFRGCSILRGSLLLGRQEKEIEMCFDGDGDHWQQMEGRLLDLPSIPNHSTQDAKRSLNLIKYLCQRSKINMEFFGMLLAVVDQWGTSSLSGSLFPTYFKFVQIYLAISKMSNGTFYAFIDETNQVARVLIAHFLAIQKIMGPILCREAEISNPSSLNDGLGVRGGIRGHEKWVEAIWSQLTRDGELKWKESMEWPRAIFRSENSDNFG
ncbi:putative c6 zinc finger domain protein [Botrytis fragariae]|uniref:Putative c6 zinc finger domain protein n=1 Tax=Botrytis fragariae TaxID=1964551 RepID=A0A8H6AJV7_9HELO|nr:putative c6 zinc finger domain protein [Botrytis fragariae]KAF5868699.1 putative c6 zinc finger domain protein [Botrytis fragariae]